MHSPTQYSPTQAFKASDLLRSTSYGNDVLGNLLGSLDELRSSMEVKDRTIAKLEAARRDDMLKMQEQEDRFAEEKRRVLARFEDEKELVLRAVSKMEDDKNHKIRALEALLEDKDKRMDELLSDVCRGGGGGGGGWGGGGVVSMGWTCTSECFNVTLKNNTFKIH